MSETTATRTITGRDPRTGDPMPVTLAANETVIGALANGTPLVRRADGAFGGTFGVAYACDGPARSDLEWFDPLGLGAF